MKITVELTDDEIESILITAGTACAYWARTVEPLRSVMHGPTFALEVMDVDLQPLGVLTRSSLRTAGTLLVMDQNYHPASIGRFIHDPKASDNHMSDIFVQLALFGEVRYG